MADEIQSIEHTRTGRFRLVSITRMMRRWWHYPMTIIDAKSTGWNAAISRRHLIAILLLLIKFSYWNANDNWSKTLIWNEEKSLVRLLTTVLMFSWRRPLGEWPERLHQRRPFISKSIKTTLCHLVCCPLASSSYSTRFFFLTLFLCSLFRLVRLLLPGGQSR